MKIGERRDEDWREEGWREERGGMEIERGGMKIGEKRERRVRGHQTCASLYPSGVIQSCRPLPDRWKESFYIKTSSDVTHVLRSNNTLTNRPTDRLTMCLWK